VTLDIGTELDEHIVVDDVLVSLPNGAAVVLGMLAVGVKLREPAGE
jgi:hypothetical protein